VVIGKGDSPGDAKARQVQVSGDRAAHTEHASAFTAGLIRFL